MPLMRSVRPPPRRIMPAFSTTFKRKVCANLLGNETALAPESPRCPPAATRVRVPASAVEATRLLTRFQTDCTRLSTTGACFCVCWLAHTSVKYCCTSSGVRGVPLVPCHLVLSGEGLVRAPRSLSPPTTLASKLLHPDTICSLISCAFLLAADGCARSLACLEATAESLAALTVRLTHLPMQLPPVSMMA